MGRLEQPGVGSTVTAAGITTFLGLFDTPFNYDGEGTKFVTVSPSEAGLTFSVAAVSTVTTFLDLTDTFQSYAGQSGSIVVVNPSETGLTTNTLEQILCDSFVFAYGQY